MKKYTKKELSEFVRLGLAIDISEWQVNNLKNYSQIGYSTGTYGCNGKLIINNDTGDRYVILGNKKALFIF